GADARRGGAGLAGVLRGRQMIALQEALGTAGRGDLRAGGGASRIRAVPRFGARSERRILAAIAALETRDPRVKLAEALRQGERLLDLLRRQGAVERVALAGDLRRRVELIDRLDVVVASLDPARALEQTTRLSVVRHATILGASEARLRLVSGLDARVTATAPAAHAV